MEGKGQRALQGYGAGLDGFDPPFLLLAKHYDEAIELYSKAIELNSGVAVYYGNRSMAYLKTESYGYAHTDASKAVELDPSYIKVCVQHSC